MDTQSHCPVSHLSFVEPLRSLSVRPLLPQSDPSSGAPSHASQVSNVVARGRRKKRKSVHVQGESYKHATAIDMLPDNALVEIFDLSRRTLRYNILPAWRWHLLVHVCQRWRQIIFASPHRLKLQILCTHKTPVRKNLGIWPAFPITIDYRYSGRSIRPKGEGNVIAALEHPGRLYYVRLAVTGSQLRKMAAVMQKPFPMLTHLEISLCDGAVLVLPAEFLGGSAPRLQAIHLNAIPFPPLSALLLSLVTLSLRNIPLAGYTSPEAMVVSLAALPRLENLIIEFQSAASRPDRLRPPPVTRTVLPALTFFEFNGASEYLEDLVGRIDSPQLDQILIDYLNQLVDFQVVQLSKFIDRSVGPEIIPRHAHVTFSDDRVSFDIHRHANSPPWDWYPVRTTISCSGIDWQVSHMAQVLSQFSTTLSNVVHFKLKAEPEGRPSQLKGTGNVEWLYLLHQLSTVRTLHVSQELARHVALALQDITEEMVAEVLPSLDLICLVGQLTSSVEKFVAVRRISGRPITVIDTETEYDERLGSYVSE